MSHRRSRPAILLTAATLLILVAVSLAGAPRPLAAAPWIQIVVDGERLYLDALPVVDGGRVLLPFRGLFEALGAQVRWDPATAAVEASLDGRTVRFVVGATVALVDGAEVPLDVPARLLGGRTLVPARFAAEVLGARVDWDEANRRVVITTGRPRAPRPAAGRATLAFVGDVLLGARIGEVIAARGVDYPWDKVRDILGAADLAVANLETSVTTRGTPETKQYTFRSHPDTLAGLVRGGVDLVTLANNHSLDYGAVGLLDTLDHLDAAGVRRVGAGRTLAEAMRPAVFDLNGVRVGVLGLAQVYPSGSWTATDTRPGIAPVHNQALVRAVIAALAADVDFVVVTVHWGEEKRDAPTDVQRRYGRLFIDAGAHLVVGHHPHVLQGIELYQGRPIVYSLGNFVFPFTVPETQRSAVLQATVVKEGGAARLVELGLIPIFTGAGQPAPASPELSEVILGRLRRLSADLGTEIRPDGLVVLPPEP